MIIARVLFSSSRPAYLSIIALTLWASILACAGSYTPHGRSQCAYTGLMVNSFMMVPPDIAALIIRRGDNRACCGFLNGNFLCASEQFRRDCRSVILRVLSYHGSHQDECTVGTR